MPAPVTHQTTASREVLMANPAAPPVVRASYMEDPDQRRLYQTRTIATVAVLVVLVLTFVWGLSSSLDSLGAWWDDFFGNLRV